MVAVEYKYTDVTFIITEKKLAVETRLQFFIIIPAEPYFHKRWEVLRMLIECGEIKKISDLADYGSGKMMWIVSKRKYL